VTPQQAFVKLEIAIPFALWHTWDTDEGLLATLQAHGLFPQGIDRRAWTYRTRVDGANQTYIVALAVGFPLPAKAQV
jgi:hypothetical protein